jgi:hypothetical protein
MKAPRDLIRQIPNLDMLSEQLHDEPEAIMARAFPEEDTGLRGRGLIGLEELEDITEVPDYALPVSSERERWFVAGTRAITKIKDEGEDADLDPEELVGLEAIVLIEGRPAIFIQNGHFFPPPSGWQVLEEVRESIEETCRSIGRVEVTGHPSYEWVGTGFLVAPSVVMTNAHVAEVFCRMERRRRWRFRPDMAAQIDYVEELGALESAEFELRSVIGVHETFDLALFRVRRTSPSGVKPPEPLTIASRPPATLEGTTVYTVGYPAWDGYRNDPQVMMRIFSNVFGVKRLQPGEVTQSFDEQGVLVHDCSTLGGNSGSCVIDLESNQVIGLHYGGKYRRGNVAVALWRLTDDPLLKKAKVNFD